LVEAEAAQLGGGEVFLWRPFCNRHLQHSRPCIYGPSGNDANLPIMKHEEADEQKQQNQPMPPPLI
jgi:hypothetical protein